MTPDQFPQGTSFNWAQHASLLQIRFPFPADSCRPKFPINILRIPMRFPCQPLELVIYSQCVTALGSHPGTFEGTPH